jgi:polysaccharide pyruvyl transferase WcaK-like protein
MKRAVVYGYFTGENYGDQWIRETWCGLLSGFKIDFRLHSDPPEPRDLRRADLVVIGGGGLVFERMGLWEDPRSWMTHVRGPLVVAGLGINRVDPGLAEAVTFLADSAEIFWVRDEESRSLLNHHNRIQVGPDLAWLRPRRFPVCAGGALLVAPAPCPWRDFPIGRWQAELSRIQTMGAALHCGDGRDRKLLEELGVPVSSEPVERLMASCEAVLASRYHALILATQNNVPFLALDYDYKIGRLTKEWNLEEWLIDPSEPHLLGSKLKEIHRNRADLVKRLDEINGLESDRARLLENDLLRVINRVRSGPDKPGWVSRLVGHRRRSTGRAGRIQAEHGEI